MKAEEKIKECEFNLRQIKHFEPEPYYVEHFFKLFLKYVDKTYDDIFQEASYGFGLSRVENKEDFINEARRKKDQNAINFVDWFNERFDSKHETPYPHFILSVSKFQKKFNKLPEIKIMLRSKERYSNDVVLEVVVGLNNDKLRTKDELMIEVNRSMPVFLDLINHKRELNGEPKIRKNQITVSTFIQDNDEYFEVIYGAEIYLGLLKRFLIESRKFMRDML